MIRDIEVGQVVVDECYGLATKHILAGDSVV
jgi:hypothetical protein